MCLASILMLDYDVLALYRAISMLALAICEAIIEQNKLNKINWDKRR